VAVTSVTDRVLAAVDAVADEAVAFTSEMIRIPDGECTGRSVRGPRAIDRGQARRLRFRRRISLVNATKVIALAILELRSLPR